MADMTDIETAFPDIQTNLSNPEPRCPVVLLLDVSASMQGEKIRALNEGVAQLSHYLRQDRPLSLRVEIAIVAAGEETLVLDCQGGQAVYPTGDAFVPAEDFIPPPLQAHGVRKLGEGMRLALKLLRDRKDELRAQGDVCYCPRILLVSDGAPMTTDGSRRPMPLSPRRGEGRWWCIRSASKAPTWPPFRGFPSVGHCS